MSFENGNFVYLSLGAIPILVGLGESETKGPRNLFLMASLVGLTLLMALASERIQLTSLDVMLLFSIFMMGLGPMTLRRVDTESELSTLSEEKIFFHDLVGEVHGINLYLASFKNEERLAPYEMKAMMKSLSLMIESHYRNHHGMSHRNLNISQKYDVAECLEELKFVVKSYLGASHIKVHFTYKGMMENHSSWKHLHLNKANFRRLMVNICKNIAESGSNHVEFVFDGNVQGLHFEVKNNLTGLSSTTKDLDAHLGAVISNADKEAPLELRGLGLMSMAQNCEEFQFRFEGHCWITSGILLWEAEGSAAPLKVAS